MENVSQLCNHPVMSLLVTRMSGTSTDMVSHHIRLVVYYEYTDIMEILFTVNRENEKYRTDVRMKIGVMKKTKN
jgi:hypothetical protein